MVIIQSSSICKFKNNEKKSRHDWMMIDWISNLFAFVCSSIYSTAKYYFSWVSSANLFVCFLSRKITKNYQQVTFGSNSNTRRLVWSWLLYIPYRTAPCLRWYVRDFYDELCTMYTTENVNTLLDTTTTCSFATLPNVPTWKSILVHLLSYQPNHS